MILLVAVSLGAKLGKNLGAPLGLWLSHVFGMAGPGAMPLVGAALLGAGGVVLGVWVGLRLKSFERTRLRSWSVSAGGFIGLALPLLFFLFSGNHLNATLRDLLPGIGAAIADGIVRRNRSA